MVESTRSAPASGALLGTFVVFAHGDKSACLELAPLFTEAAAKRAAGGSSSAAEVAKIDALKAKALATLIDSGRGDILKHLHVGRLPELARANCATSGR